MNAQAEAATTNAAGACFHCGLPLPVGAPWMVVIDGASRSMCCAGCRAVAAAIVDNGLGDYYRTRIGFSASAGQELPAPEQLRLLDAEQDATPIAETADDAQCSEAIFSVEGMRCAACVWLIERCLARLPGVQSVELNVANGRLGMRWRRDACQPSVIAQTLRAIGYAAYPYDPVRSSAQLEKEQRKMFRRLFVAGLSMMQVMMYAVPAYLATDGAMDDGMRSLMRWAGLALTLPALLYSAQPFFGGAWSNLKNRLPGMDVPVALGITAAFAGSVAATWRGIGDVYFDSITMFIFLLLCSRYLELGARRKAASALDALQHALPASAWRMPAYPARRETEMIAVAQLRCGDVVLLKPGESLAADGVVLEGESGIDLSLLTGESRVQHVASGAAVPGGAVNVEQALVVRIARAAGDSTLSLLMKLVDRAGQGKPQMALWADRVAAWFVAALLLLALAVFIFWQWHEPARAWPIAIAVLVVSCPCALSLAMPTALAAAADFLLWQRVLIVRSHVLEALNRATHVVFDKTGTLTVGKPALQHLEKMSVSPSEWCLFVAGALEAGSMHPLAGALGAAAAQADLTKYAGLPIEDVRHVAGHGMEGTIGGVRYRLGRAAFIEEIAGGALLRAEPPQAISIYLGTDGHWLARFDFSDPLRADARGVVEYFRSHGKTVILLSGDRQAVAQYIGAQLGIELAIGDTLPDGKLAYVQALQREGAKVAMVGDGVNDAAVLSAADVSFAMGGGAALAQIQADCVLLSGRLSSLTATADMAERTGAVIRQNLSWAVLYNLVAIPAAAFGLLNPWITGVGMSLSSAAVVLNALRLRRMGALSTATHAARGGVASWPARHGLRPARTPRVNANGS